MSLPLSTIRLSQRALIVWTLLFVLSSWTGFEGANVLEISPPWLPPGPLKFITHTIALLPAGLRSTALLAVPWLIAMLAAWELWRPGQWWRTLLVWWLYTNVMNAGWLAGSGGQQLMANLLLWNAVLALALKRKWGSVGLAVFWIARLQLLIVYAATGLHKLTGDLWLDGTAIGVAATDPAFGPAWIAAFPVAATIATWAMLFFQLTFPLAVWWMPTRYGWMLFGIAFHIATGFWMDIPEMGFAFITAYAIWCDARLVMRIAPLRWIAAER